MRAHHPNLKLTVTFVHRKGSTIHDVRSELPLPHRVVGGRSEERMPCQDMESVDRAVHTNDGTQLNRALKYGWL